jgi:hypothetical protein
MTLRPGFIYALILALGLVLWTGVYDQVHQAPALAPSASQEADVTPWTDAQAVHECALKARELHLAVADMRTAADSRQGSLALTGRSQDLRTFYAWLENEGRFRSILSFDWDMADPQASRMQIVYQL